MRTLRAAAVALLTLTIWTAPAQVTWRKAGSLADQVRATIAGHAGPLIDSLIPAGTVVESVSVSPELRRVTVALSPTMLWGPVRPERVDEMRVLVEPLLSSSEAGMDLVFVSEGEPLEHWIPRLFGGEGAARDREHEVPPPPGPAFVRRQGERGVETTQGLQGRHIALWHSHGWYYSENSDRWEWQRPRLFTTVEDMLPMSFVLPFLVPMLEDAGANAFLPRERDFQPHEVIVDDGEAALSGEWTVGREPGFRDIAPMPQGINPHMQGTQRIARASGQERSNCPAATYVPDIPADGDYAVTVCYAASDENATDVPFVVRHAGGASEFKVNERMAGHTWVYLGTFTFRAGRHEDTGSVQVLASSADEGALVSVDAVRFGGGMGTVEVGGRTSGRPRYLEGAAYWLQFAGIPPEAGYHWNPNWNQYDSDYACRPEWVNWLRGAPCGPNRRWFMPGGNIPIDLSLAFHTDAGVSADNVIGSLMLWTPTGDQGNAETHLPDGRPRWLNRELGDLIQSQIVDDVRRTYTPAWIRRQLHNRGLAENRRPNVPSALLELLSHQNFLDAQMELDPRFRFTVARAIYKGMVRFIASENGFDPVITPLAPTHFAVEAAGEGEFHLSWQPQEDPLEPTASPSGYLVYHREGGPVGERWLVARGGGFGEPVFTREPAIALRDLAPGVIHSFRVTAVNSGGESFPTTILAAGWAGAEAPRAVVVDAFDRIGPPFIVNDATRQGFDRSVDRGVGFGFNSGLTGDQIDFDPSHQWESGSPYNNDNPGHGASAGDMETQREEGNLFDYTALHAAPLLALGYTVSAMTDEAATESGLPHGALVDWLLGEERTTQPEPYAAPGEVMHADFEALPAAHRARIEQHLQSGGQLILSGAHWATDLQASEDGRAFLHDMLGVEWIADKATEVGRVIASPLGAMASLEAVDFETGLGRGVSYGCESPDAINATTGSEERTGRRPRSFPLGRVVLRYAATESGAAVESLAPTPGRAVSFGFPLECVADDAQREALFARTVALFASPE